MRYVRNTMSLSNIWKQIRSNVKEVYRKSRLREKVKANVKGV